MNDSTFQLLTPYLTRIQRLGHMASVLNFDVETKTPEKGIEEQYDLISELGSQIDAIFKDPSFVEAVTNAAKDPSLSPMQKAVVDSLKKDIDYAAKVDLDTLREWDKAISKCNEVWAKCKGKSDYQTLLPYFKKLVDIKRKEAELRKKETHSTLYDAFLDLYEPGFSQERLDALLYPVRDFIVEKLPEVLKRQNEVTILPHSVDSQRHLSDAVLELEGFDFSRGCIAESEHPFTDWPGKNDFRVTTHYYEEDWRSSLFSVLHEGGHAIHGQLWPEEYYENYCQSLATSAICETHSRFFENIIGRSPAFAPVLLKVCQDCLGEEFLSMSPEQFHQAVSVVRPNLIRTDADEFTYVLHIVIRYELEKLLINGEIECEELPGLWKEKYKAYLGVDVPDDGKGVMQDIHWFSGSFGYFPSYALGNFYGASLLESLRKDLPFDELLRKGDLAPIRKWMEEKDVCFDYLPPTEWIVKATGNELDYRPFVSYLTERYLR